MSSLMEAAAGDPTAQQPPQPANFVANAMNYSIKRIGARPLSFQGSELGMAMSYTPSIPYWYEINIYKSVDQTFVLAIRLFHQSKDETNTVRAWECETLPDALDKMEQYDASQDVKIAMLASPNKMSLAELAAASLDLRAQIQAAKSHYASLIGEFFYDLEHGS